MLAVRPVPAPLLARPAAVQRICRALLVCRRVLVVSLETRQTINVTHAQHSARHALLAPFLVVLSAVELSISVAHQLSAKVAHPLARLASVPPFARLASQGTRWKAITARLVAQVVNSTTTASVNLALDALAARLARQPAHLAADPRICGGLRVCPLVLQAGLRTQRTTNATVCLLFMR